MNPTKQMNKFSLKEILLILAAFILLLQPTSVRAEAQPLFTQANIQPFVYDCYDEETMITGPEFIYADILKPKEKIEITGGLNFTFQYMIEGESSVSVHMECQTDPNENFTFGGKDLKGEDYLTPFQKIKIDSCEIKFIPDSGFDEKTFPYELIKSEEDDKIIGFTAPTGTEVYILPLFISKLNDPNAVNLFNSPDMSNGGYDTYFKIYPNCSENTVNFQAKITSSAIAKPISCPSFSETFINPEGKITMEISSPSSTGSLQFTDLSLPFYVKLRDSSDYLALGQCRWRPEDGNPKALGKDTINLEFKNSGETYNNDRRCFFSRGKNSFTGLPENSDLDFVFFGGYAAAGDPSVEHFFNFKEGQNQIPEENILIQPYLNKNDAYRCNCDGLPYTKTISDDLICECFDRATPVEGNNGNNGNIKGCKCMDNYDPSAKDECKCKEGFFLKETVVSTNPEKKTYSCQPLVNFTFAMNPLEFQCLDKESTIGLPTSIQLKVNLNGEEKVYSYGQLTIEMVLIDDTTDFAKIKCTTKKDDSDDGNTEKDYSASNSLIDLPVECEFTKAEGDYELLKGTDNDKDIYLTGFKGTEKLKIGVLSFKDQKGNSLMKINKDLEISAGSVSIIKMVTNPDENYNQMHESCISPSFIEPSFTSPGFTSPFVCEDFALSFKNPKSSPEKVELNLNYTLASDATLKNIYVPFLVWIKMKGDSEYKKAAYGYCLQEEGKQFVKPAEGATGADAFKQIVLNPNCKFITETDSSSNYLTEYPLKAFGNNALIKIEFLDGKAEADNNSGYSFSFNSATQEIIKKNDGDTNVCKCPDGRKPNEDYSKCICDILYSSEVDGQCKCPENSVADSTKKACKCENSSQGMILKKDSTTEYECKNIPKFSTSYSPFSFECLSEESVIGLPSEMKLKYLKQEDLSVAGKMKVEISILEVDKDSKETVITTIKCDSEKENLSFKKPGENSFTYLTDIKLADCKFDDLSLADPLPKNTDYEILTTEDDEKVLYGLSSNYKLKFMLKISDENGNSLLNDESMEIPMISNKVQKTCEAAELKPKISSFTPENDFYCEGDEITFKKEDKTTFELSNYDKEITAKKIMLPFYFKTKEKDAADFSYLDFGICVKTKEDPEKITKTDEGEGKVMSQIEMKCFLLTDGQSSFDPKKELTDDENKNAKELNYTGFKDNTAISMEMTNGIIQLDGTEGNYMNIGYQKETKDSSAETPTTKVDYVDELDYPIYDKQDGVCLKCELPFVLNKEAKKCVCGHLYGFEENEKCLCPEKSKLSDDKKSCVCDDKNQAMFLKEGKETDYECKNIPKFSVSYSPFSFGCISEETVITPPSEIKLKYLKQEDITVAGKMKVEISILEVDKDSKETEISTIKCNSTDSNINFTKPDASSPFTHLTNIKLENCKFDELRTEGTEENPLPQGKTYEFVESEDKVKVLAGLSSDYNLKFMLKITDEYEHNLLNEDSGKVEIPMISNKVQKTCEAAELKPNISSFTPENDFYCEGDEVSFKKGDKTTFELSNYDKEISAKKIMLPFYFKTKEKDAADFSYLDFGICAKTKEDPEKITKTDEGEGKVMSQIEMKCFLLTDGQSSFDPKKELTDDGNKDAKELNYTGFKENTAIIMEMTNGIIQLDGEGDYMNIGYQKEKKDTSDATKVEYVDELDYPIYDNQDGVCLKCELPFVLNKEAKKCVCGNKFNLGDDKCSCPAGLTRIIKMTEAEIEDEKAADSLYTSYCACPDKQGFNSTDQKVCAPIPRLFTSENNELYNKFLTEESVIKNPKKILLKINKDDAEGRQIFAPLKIKLHVTNDSSTISTYNCKYEGENIPILKDRFFIEIPLNCEATLTEYGKNNKYELLEGKALYGFKNGDNINIYIDYIKDAYDNQILYNNGLPVLYASWIVKSYEKMPFKVKINNIFINKKEEDSIYVCKNSIFDFNVNREETEPKISLEMTPTASNAEDEMELSFLFLPFYVKAQSKKDPKKSGYLDFGQCYIHVGSFYIKKNENTIVNPLYCKLYYGSNDFLLEKAFENNDDVKIEFKAGQVYYNGDKQIVFPQIDEDSGGYITDPEIFSYSFIQNITNSTEGSCKECPETTILDDTGLQCTCGKGAEATKSESNNVTGEMDATECRCKNADREFNKDYTQCICKGNLILSKDDQCVCGTYAKQEGNDCLCPDNSTLSEDKSECVCNKGFEMNKVTEKCDIKPPEIPSLVPVADPTDVTPMTVDTVIFTPKVFKIKNEQIFKYSIKGIISIKGGVKVHYKDNEGKDAENIVIKFSCKSTKENIIINSESGFSEISAECKFEDQPTEKGNELGFIIVTDESEKENKRRNLKENGNLRGKLRNLQEDEEKGLFGFKEGQSYEIVLSDMADGDENKLLKAQQAEEEDKPEVPYPKIDTDYQTVLSESKISNIKTAEIKIDDIKVDQSALEIKSEDFVCQETKFNIKKNANIKLTANDSNSEISNLENVKIPFTLKAKRKDEDNPSEPKSFDLAYGNCEFDNVNITSDNQNYIQANSCSIIDDEGNKTETVLSSIFEDNDDVTLEFGDGFGLADNKKTAVIIQQSDNPQPMKLTQRTDGLCRCGSGMTFTSNYAECDCKEGYIKVPDGSACIKPEDGGNPEIDNDKKDVKKALWILFIVILCLAVLGAIISAIILCAGGPKGGAAATTMGGSSAGYGEAAKSSAA